MTEPKFIPVFTYGTLREGQYNAKMLAGGVESAFDATVKGFTLYANTSDSYPYLVKDETATEPVKGTLYLLNADHPAFLKADRMELGAGYNREIIKVDVTDKRGEVHEIDAICWTWNRPQWLGARIPDGDWIAYAETHSPVFFRANSRNWK
ncbi:hypothetical protein SALGADO_97 [Arthrobacter phage Salgado]|uniref:Gamma-glutamylcyclotransferase AIG2-like domain-containing protein n=3 Tax=Laroyevirus TaxID=1982086 RepID=A0A0U4IHY5_9CAUD|nr:gamma-glutamyl cyclotransferase [Arthrobacter phage Laroye]YP_010082607.1 gamma-glutamyl cyclotransferase [Arthrobacter phage LiSara]YP_010082706.1 gamma-glutamyl cyclotransferase [Arthrobacter phage Salgado]ALY09621.1 hypothetical protein LAROYE_97 [Arthrobacter phage Laroye]ALY10262.1 hypothetical protein SALGADO_97 [Arthrobacter phage Salgado]ASR83677.1 hypothetical protein SEA_LISARA_94 [Arthrobacter phage LiSara]